MARKSIWRPLVIVGWLLTAQAGTMAGATGLALLPQADAPAVRVRATSPRVASLIRKGREGSQTFRSLLDRLEALDVLVYVLPGRCRRQDTVRLAGCLVFLGRESGVRHFRIVVDLNAVERRIIATIGHELQHALEVVDAGLTQPGDVPIGTEVRTGVYETDEAERVGRAVLVELGRVRERSRSSARSAQRISAARTRSPFV